MVKLQHLSHFFFMFCCCSYLCIKTLVDCRPCALLFHKFFLVSGSYTLAAKYYKGLKRRRAHLFSLSCFVFF